MFVKILCELAGHSFVVKILNYDDSYTCAVTKNFLDLDCDPKITFLLFKTAK